ENASEPDNLTTTDLNQDNTTTTDSTFILKDNVSSLLKNCLRFSVRKSNNIENISKMVEHSAQDSGNSNDF
ncbi:17242_t:CDS:2, partial [Racocetra fulgida]